MFYRDDTLDGDILLVVETGAGGRRHIPKGHDLLVVLIQDCSGMITNCHDQHIPRNIIEAEVNRLSRDQQ